jgi:hypothetical protein
MLEPGLLSSNGLKYILHILALAYVRSMYTSHLSAAFIPKVDMQVSCMLFVPSDMFVFPWILYIPRPEPGLQC